jgi:hypothetical protein
MNQRESWFLTKIDLLVVQESEAKYEAAMIAIDAKKRSVWRNDE